MLVDGKLNKHNRPLLYMTPKKIYIIGPPGSGKTRFAFILSKKLSISKHNLDEVYWKRKYDLKRKEEERKKILFEIIKEKNWIVEGVYGSWTEPAIQKSDIVIWIDIPFLLIVFRIILRFLRKWKKDKKEGWKSTFNLIKKVYEYKIKSEKSFYLSHKQLIEKSKSKVIIIKSNKEMNKVLAEF